MGLFNRLGRQVEQFRQTARSTAKQEADYQCGACGVELYTRPEECPECGAEQIERTSD